MRPKCGTCTWYDLDPKNLKQGVCVRFPPRGQAIHLGNGRMVEGSTLPTVKVDFGCGEHRLKLVDAARLVAG